MNKSRMLRLIVFVATVTACLSSPVFYGGEPFLAGHLENPAVVSGPHLPPPIVKTYAHSPLYGFRAYPAIVKTPVVTPVAGFIKAPIVPTAYGHYGHVSPYLH